MRYLTLISILFFTIMRINAQQLESYIQEAEKNNPEIQKYELQFRIASEKINEVNFISNTEFGLGIPVSEPETRTGPQSLKLSARQQIPWFGVITARANYASSLAETKYEDIVIAKRKLRVSVSQSYYNLYTIVAKQNVLQQNIELLKTYEELALNSVEVGKASAVDVLRLRIRQNDLKQLKEVLKQKYIAEQTLFNKLLNREKSIEIDLMSELIILLETDLDDSENLTLHPELVKYDKLFQSITQSELLNKKENSPTIGFGLEYIAVSEGPLTNFSDNGKDIFIPSISVSVPVFNKKYKSRTKQNRLKQEEIMAEKQERLNKLETLLESAITNRIAARTSYETQIENLKVTKEAESILIKSYETGTVDFNDVLDIQELELKFQINKIECIKNYYLQTTIINYLSN